MTDVIPSSWRPAYEDWFKRARPSLEARDGKRVFADYPRMELPAMPPTRLQKPLGACRVALISSCGLTGAGQRPFDDENILGDDSFRVIPDKAPLTAWTIHHGHYDSAAAQEDYNTVFPLDALHDLASQGKIGAPSRRHFTFMGYQPDPEPFLEASVPEMIRLMKADGVDVALLVPV